MVRAHHSAPGQVMANNSVIYAPSLLRSCSWSKQSLLMGLMIMTGQQVRLVHLYITVLCIVVRSVSGTLYVVNNKLTTFDGLKYRKFSPLEGK